MLVVYDKLGDTYTTYQSYYGVSDLDVFNGDVFNKFKSSIHSVNSTTFGFSKHSNDWTGCRKQMLYLLQNLIIYWNKMTRLSNSFQDLLLLKNEFRVATAREPAHGRGLTGFPRASRERMNFRLLFHEKLETSSLHRSCFACIFPACPAVMGDAFFSLLIFTIFFCNRKKVWLKKLSWQTDTNAKNLTGDKKPSGIQKT